MSDDIEWDYEHWRSHVSPKRIASLLSPFGFRPSKASHSQIIFARATENPDVFEQIHIQSQFIKGERYDRYVSAFIQISVVKGITGARGLSESRCLTSEFRAKSGLTTIKSQRDGTAWEMLLANCVTPALKTFSLGIHDTLIARTKMICGLANRIHAKIPNVDRLLDILPRMEKLATSRQQNEAARLFKFGTPPPGAISRAAIYAIVIYCDELFGTGNPYWGADPDKFFELFQLIQLVADRIGRDLWFPSDHEDGFIWKQIGSNDTRTLLFHHNGVVQPIE